MLSVPVFVPFPFGLKRTDIEQLEPAGIPDDDRQLLDCKKLELLTLMLETCRATLPLFDTVIVCAALVVPVLVVGKTRLVVDSATVVPVPVNDTVFGLPPAFTVNVPVLVPAAVGVNFTDIAQLLAAATLVPQVFVCEKLPVVVMPEMVNGAVPGLLNVTVCAGLVVFTSCVENVSEVGERVTEPCPAELYATGSDI
jgi:hypothetical protein